MLVGNRQPFQIFHRVDILWLGAARVELGPDGVRVGVEDVPGRVQPAGEQVTERLKPTSNGSHESHIVIS